jgi:hypothetical protein
MFKPFFVHRHHGPGKLPNRSPRGFTMLVSPCLDPVGNPLPHLVHVQTAWCSPKDQFCKRAGRSQAQIATLERLNKRKLAFEIAMNEFHCNLTDVVNEASWNYIYKYML